MKNIASIAIVLLAAFFLAPQNASAQKATKMDTVKIKTSAECDMCKTKLETEVGRSKGVKSASLDLSTQVLTVVYNSAKTNPGKLRTIIANIGYDADDVKANNRMQKKLPDCCQPGKKCDTVPAPAPK